MPRERIVRCKYCGAKLERDEYGSKCPTPNCQWEHGIPEHEEWGTKPERQDARRRLS